MRHFYIFNIANGRGSASDQAIKRMLGTNEDKHINSRNYVDKVTKMPHEDDPDEYDMYIETASYQLNKAVTDAIASDDTILAVSHERGLTGNIDYIAMCRDTDWLPIVIDVL